MSDIFVCKMHKKIKENILKTEYYTKMTYNLELFLKKYRLRK